MQKDGDVGIPAKDKTDAAIKPRRWPKCQPKAPEKGIWGEETRPFTLADNRRRQPTSIMPIDLRQEARAKGHEKEGH
jgi:hypothetical protein